MQRNTIEPAPLGGAIISELPDSQAQPATVMPKSRTVAASAKRGDVMANFRFALPLQLAAAVCAGIAWLMTANVAAVFGAAVTPNLFWLGVAAMPLAMFLTRTSAVPGVQLDIELRNHFRAISLVAGLSLTTLVCMGATSAMPWVCVIFVATGSLVPVIDILVRSLISKAAWWSQPVMVVGTPTETRMIHQWLAKNRILGLRPVTSATDQPNCVIAGKSVDQQDVDNLFWQYPRVLHAKGGEELELMALSSRGGLFTERTNWLCSPVLFSMKRFVDFALIAVAVPVLIPTFAVLALAVRSSSPGSIFFRQSRVGKCGRRFYAWKFRTMRVDAERALQEYLAVHPELKDEWERESKLKDDPRVTSIGNFLRKSSLDELPQLWNVLIGDMSLVGPRPMLLEEIEKYGDTYEDYVRVLPGITGLWQVSGRNNTTYPERLRYVRHYVRNWSPWMDLYILILTIRTVVLRDGAY